MRKFHSTQDRERFSVFAMRASFAILEKDKDTEPSPAFAVDYNAIPVGDGSNEVYSGITIASGMVTQDSMRA